MKKEKLLWREEIKKLICKRIINLREKSKLTLIELSKISNISIEELMKIEKGLKLPKLHTIYDICTGLNITLHDFFDWDELNDFLKQ